MKAKHRRLVAVVTGVTILGAATFLALFAVQDNLVFFHEPTEVLSGKVKPDQRFRLGGLVETGTVKHIPDTATIDFTVTDLKNAIPVVYTGIPPDLFREGQCVVAEGRLGRDGVFYADQLLAKHDENYMPKEIADGLKKNGEWDELARSCGQYDSAKKVTADAR
jgi:cytochrome c-type biogenesis protein CcmE